MEDESAIKRVGFKKLDGTNYRMWAAMAKAVIEAKDAWEAIETSVPMATASVREDRTGDGTAAQSEKEPKEELKSVPVDKIKERRPGQ
jgi:hypothetical protein